jgi:hypothetical protein
MDRLIIKVMGQDMECCGPSNERFSQIEVKFNKFDLQHLFNEDCDFKSEFERQVFMAVNVCRYQPSLFIPIVEKVMQEYPQASKCKQTATLLSVLSSMEKIPEVIYDLAAFDACRRNNQN